MALDLLIKYFQILFNNSSLSKNYVELDLYSYQKCYPDVNFQFQTKFSLKIKLTAFKNSKQLNSAPNRFVDKQRAKILSKFKLVSRNVSILSTLSSMFKGEEANGADPREQSTQCERKNAQIVKN